MTSPVSAGGTGRLGARVATIVGVMTCSIHNSPVQHAAGYIRAIIGKIRMTKCGGLRGMLQRRRKSAMAPLHVLPHLSGTVMSRIIQLAR